MTWVSVNVLLCSVDVSQIGRVSGINNIFLLEYPDYFVLLSALKSRYGANNLKCKPSNRFRVVLSENLEIQ